MFADDVILMALNKETLSKMFSCFEDFCRLNKLKISATKTEVMVMGRGEREKSTCIQLGSMEIKVVDTFKYLGIHMDNAFSR